MLFRLILAVLIIAFTIFGVFYLFKSPAQPITGEAISETAEEIIAYVNEHPVTEEDVERAQKYVEAQSGKIINRTEAIQRAINERLILQDAEKNNLSLTIEETEAEISRIFATQNKTLLDFKTRIESIGRDYNREIRYYRDQLLIQKRLNQIIEPGISDMQALEYYNSNKDRMFTGEVVVPYEQISGQLKLALDKKQDAEAIKEYFKNLYENANIVYLK